MKVCAKGLGSPGASNIRGRPRFRFIINGSKFPIPPGLEPEDPLGLGVPPIPDWRLKSVACSKESLAFLGLLPEGIEEADDELGVEVAFVTALDEEDDDVGAVEGIKLALLESLFESFDVTSAKPLILRFSAVFRSEANWCWNLRKIRHHFIVRFTRYEVSLCSKNSKKGGPLLFLLRLYSSAAKTQKTSHFRDRTKKPKVVLKNEYGSNKKIS